MTAIVSVQFNAVGKTYDFAADNFLDVVRDDYLVVESDRGLSLVQVVEPPRETRKKAGQFAPILRKATIWDMLTQERLTTLEEEACTLCRTRVKERRLEIKIISCRYDLTGGFLTVSYTRPAGTRRHVPMRDLSRELAKALGVRIEMMQINDRQVAKILDGVGKCGRQLCCTSWLREFRQLGIRMAKNQQLSMNPDEISGVCGRLLCCLSYEDEMYRSLTRSLPKVGAKVVTPQGTGRVRYIYPLKKSVTVQLEGDVLADFGVDELLPPKRESSCGPCGGCTHTRRAQAPARRNTGKNQEAEAS